MSRWVDGAVEPRLAERARIILMCADGAPNTRVAADLKVTADTVRKWRSRFAAHRLEGLTDMPRPGRRKAELVLSEAERHQLMRWARRAKTAQFLALRARIVLRCTEGGTNKQVAAELGVSEQSVNRWRARFIKRRLDGLVDEPRPGRPPSILLDQVEDVVVATLESTPGLAGCPVGLRSSRAFLQAVKVGSVRPIGRRAGRWGTASAGSRRSVIMDCGDRRCSAAAGRFCLIFKPDGLHG